MSSCFIWLLTNQNSALPDHDQNTVIPQTMLYLSLFRSSLSAFQPQNNRRANEVIFVFHHCRIKSVIINSWGESDPKMKFEQVPLFITQRSFFGNWAVIVWLIFPNFFVMDFWCYNTYIFFLIVITYIIDARSLESSYDHRDTAAVPALFNMPPLHSSHNLLLLSEQNSTPHTFTYISAS